MKAGSKLLGGKSHSVDRFLGDYVVIRRSLPPERGRRSWGVQLGYFMAIPKTGHLSSPSLFWEARNFSEMAFRGSEMAVFSISAGQGVSSGPVSAT